MNLEVLFTPADFAALATRDLKNTACVVLDVFRATSTMITALANGASTIIPVGEISEALAIRKREPDVLLCGEREGLRIRAALTGGIDFDFGNSPREFTKEKVAGRTLVMTTTNGTQALRACARAKQVLIGSFLNLQATADLLARQNPENLLVVCSGTFEQAAFEDVLAAGALCDVLWEKCEGGAISDSAQMSRQLFQLAQNNLLNAAQQSRNGRRLFSRPELREDVAFCLQRDIYNFVAMMQPDGIIRQL